MKTNAVSKSLKVTKAKTQLYTHSTVYYVSRESNPDEKYIVVRTSKGIFCQCMDFITRRLPLFGTSAFTVCKHISAVQAKLEKISVPAKRYAVWFVGDGCNFRSIDVPGTFPSRVAAERAILSHKRYGLKLDDYEVHPVK